jgi:hypothetical protein
VSINQIIHHSFWEYVSQFIQSVLWSGREFVFMLDYHFGGISVWQQQVLWMRSNDLQTAATCSRWFLARGFFYLEDGGDMFLRNVGSNKIYMAPHPRRRHSSQSPSWKPQILRPPSCFRKGHPSNFGRKTKYSECFYCVSWYLHD